MTRPGFSIRILGLCAFVLALLVLMNNVVEAETGATWKVNGASVGALEPQLEISEIESESGGLSFKTAGGKEVEIACTAAKISEGGRLTSNGSISAGRVLFTGCTTAVNGAVSASCKPRSSGKSLGEIQSEKAMGLIVLDAGNDLVKITPVVGKRLATIELGLECVIGETVNVEVSEAGEGFWIKDGNGNTGFLTESTMHLIVEGLSKLIALGQPAKISGSAIVQLAGAHSGLVWSGKPA